MRAFSKLTSIFFFFCSMDLRFPSPTPILHFVNYILNTRQYGCNLTMNKLLRKRICGSYQTFSVSISVSLYVTLSQSSIYFFTHKEKHYNICRVSLIWCFSLTTQTLIIVLYFSNPLEKL